MAEEEIKTTKKTTTRTRKKKVEETPVTPVVETAPEPEPKKTYTEDDVQKIVQEAVRTALANATANGVVAQKPASEVTIVFMGKVNRDNVLQFGRFGSIYGNFGSIQIPKSSFGGEFMTSWVRKMLDERSLTVVDGLTDAERIRYGVFYKDGEVLSENEYYNLLDMDADTLCKRYSEVCNHFRVLIASIIENARVDGDKRVNRDTIERLNKISKGINARIYPVKDIRRMGDFARTLREMGVVDV